MKEKRAPIGPHIGGTVIAVFVAFIVVMVISTIASVLMSSFHYFFGSLRWEAAIFIGNVVGAIVSVYAARSACDATIKQYSLRVIFVVISAILCLVIGFHIPKGFNQDIVFKLASAIPMIGTAYIVFWKDDF